MILRAVAMALIVLSCGECCAQLQTRNQDGTKPSQATIDAAQRRVERAMEAWQAGEIDQARAFAIQAIAYGIPESEFGVSPQFLLRKIDASQGDFRRPSHSVREDFEPARLSTGGNTRAPRRRTGDPSSASSPAAPPTIGGRGDATANSNGDVPTRSADKIAEAQSHSPKIQRLPKVSGQNANDPPPVVVDLSADRNPIVASRGESAGSKSIVGGILAATSLTAASASGAETSDSQAPAPDSASHRVVDGGASGPPPVRVEPSSIPAGSILSPPTVAANSAPGSTTATASESAPQAPASFEATAAPDLARRGPPPVSVAPWDILDWSRSDAAPSGATRKPGVKADSEQVASDDVNVKTSRDWAADGPSTRRRSTPAPSIGVLPARSPIESADVAQTTIGTSPARVGHGPPPVDVQPWSAPPALSSTPQAGQTPTHNSTLAREHVAGESTSPSNTMSNANRGPATVINEPPDAPPRLAAPSKFAQGPARTPAPSQVASTIDPAPHTNRSSPMAPTPTPKPTSKTVSAWEHRGSLGEKSLGEKSLGEKSLGEKSLGEKSLGEKPSSPKSIASSGSNSIAAQPRASTPLGRPVSHAPYRAPSTFDEERRMSPADAPQIAQTSTRRRPGSDIAIPPPVIIPGPWPQSVTNAPFNASSDEPVRNAEHASHIAASRSSRQESAQQAASQETPATTAAPERFTGPSIPPATVDDTPELNSVAQADWDRQNANPPATDHAMATNSQSLDDTPSPVLMGYWPEASGQSSAVVAPTRRQVFGRPGAASRQPLVVSPATSTVPMHTIAADVPGEAIPRTGGIASLLGMGDEVTPEVIEEGLEVLPSRSFDEMAPETPGYVIDGSEPVFGAILNEVSAPFCNECSGIGKFIKLFRKEPCADAGIGRERIATAPMFIDIAKTTPNTFRVRFDAANNVQAPDRAEYYYSAINGKGDRASYQDVRFRLELGGERFSTATEVPIRVLDPVNQSNTAGLGDMNITVKTVLVAGEEWTVTQLFRTIMNTGSITRNLSTGHVSMEPGILFGKYLENDSYWHGQIKYRFPIGGNPLHSGQVLEIGSAISRVWYDTDQIALIPTFEANSFFILDGRQFQFNGGAMNYVPVDGEMILNLAPSMRFVLENDSDLGLLEFGLGTSVAVTSTRWHQSMFSMEMRLTF